MKIVPISLLQAELQKHYKEPVELLFHEVICYVVIGKEVVGTLEELLAKHSIDQNSFGGLSDR